MRIAIPVDGSDCSMRAVKHVIAAREHFGDLELHLVNVQPALPGEVGRFVSHEQIASFHADESAKAMAGACKLLDAAGIAYAAHALVGRVPEQIDALARQLGCDQIIMGTHGRSSLAELLVGSTTVRLLHLTSLPVLLVK
jgi:nucleotide-binding universal stress UspA family protein